jgi:steroid delta-isomerase-like uncharacterized protein
VSSSLDTCPAALYDASRTYPVRTSENTSSSRHWGEWALLDAPSFLGWLHALRWKDEILAPDFVLHAPFDPRELRGPEAVKQFISDYRNAFPDGHTTIEDQIVEGDEAVNRWTATGTHQGEFQGIAATGNQVTVTGIDIVRIAEGKLSEGWVELDGLGWMQQLGAIPAPGESEEASPT